MCLCVLSLSLIFSSPPFRLTAMVSATGIALVLLGEFWSVVVASLSSLVSVSLINISDSCSPCEMWFKCYGIAGSWGAEYGTGRPGTGASSRETCVSRFILSLLSGISPATKSQIIFDSYSKLCTASAYVLWFTQRPLLSRGPMPKSS